MNLSNDFKHYVHFIATFSLIISCRFPLSKNESKAPSSHNEQVEQSISKNLQTAPTNSPDHFGLTEIDDVHVSIVKDVKIEDSILIEGIKVPLIDLTKDGASYVQALRCTANYVLRTTTGETIIEARKSPSWSRALRSAWTKAWNDPGQCQIVGSYIMSGKYPDLAAPSGSFYYVINPCITKDESITSRNECSYDLVTSNPFTFKSTMESQLLAQTRELSAAESELQALLGEIGFIAQAFKVNLRACEDLIAHERNLLSFKRGLLQLGFMIGFTASVGYFNLNMGIMIGQMAAGIGGQIVSTQILKWPMFIANTCLSPQEPSYAGPSNTKEGTKSVTPLYNRMIDLLMTEIPAATQRVQEVQSKMNELNNSVITYDEMIASATAKGIDLLLSDETTGIPSDIPGLGAGIDPR